MDISRKIPQKSGEEKMKEALVVWGGWDGHEPKQCVDIFIPWLEESDYQVEVSDNLDSYLDEEKMKKYDLIVPCWTMGQISPEQEKGLIKAIKEDGAGLAGWHGGMCDSFRGNIEYQFMTGGQFLGHPGGIIDYEVNITKKDDPLMQGISDFKMKSEQYYMLVDPGVEVLATTTFSGEHDGIDWVKDVVMPVVWKRNFGKGRVFYSAVGHVASDFEVPEAKQLVQNGMTWATR